MEKSKPCTFDHNGECLKCDCWSQDCAWDRMNNHDYKWENKGQLEKMFEKELQKNLDKRIAQFEKSALDRFEEAADKYPDIKILWDDYNKLKGQAQWGEKFLEGYLSCISDLILIKKIM